MSIFLLTDSNSGMSFGTLFLIFNIACLIIFLSIFIPVRVVHSKYKKFVILHSVALKRLKEINSRYTFKRIPNFNMEHSYDNENFYTDISCRDYLTYQLVYSQKRVNTAMKDTLDNRELYKDYMEEIEERCKLDKYDTDELLKNRKRLKKFEKRLFIKEQKTPTIYLTISVRLTLTNINGAYRDSKCNTFSSKDIKETITKLNQRRGDFYLNDDVWKAICRVERGKVTNRMRFSIYERDGYRCKKCGRRTKDLEVDHIIPIAKGGKSTYDNLQTLCHRCNYKKGSNIEY